MSTGFLKRVATLVPLSSYRLVRAGLHRVAGAELALIADEQGYLVVAGHTHEATKFLGHWQYVKAIRITVRCQGGDQMEQLDAAIRARVEVLGARQCEVRMESAHPLREGSPFKACHDTVVLVQRHSVVMPTAESVAALLRASLEVARGIVPPMKRVCEICGGAAADLALCDGAPGYYCATCQHEIAHQFAREVEKFSRADVSERGARVSGMVAAVLLGSSAGAVASHALTGPPNFIRLLAWALGGGFLGAGIMRWVVLGAGGTSPSVIRMGLTSSWMGVLIANVSFYGVTALQHPDGAGTSRAIPAGPSLIWGIVALLAGVWIARYGAIQAVGEELPVPAMTFESLDSIEVAERENTY